MKKDELLMNMEDMLEWAQNTIKCIQFDMKDVENGEDTDTLAYDIWTVQHICEEMLGSIDNYEMFKEMK